MDLSNRGKVEVQKVHLLFLTKTVFFHKTVIVSLEFSEWPLVDTLFFVTQYISEIAGLTASKLRAHKNQTLIFVVIKSDVPPTQHHVRRLYVYRSVNTTVLVMHAVGTRSSLCKLN